MPNNTVTFEKVVDDAIIPEYAHIDDSGFDFRAIEEFKVEFGIITIARTGLRMEMPTLYQPRTGMDGYLNYKLHLELQIRPRSGLAVREGISVINSPSTIDFGYRGEIAVPMTRLIPGSYTVEKGEKFCQGVLCPVIKGLHLKEGTLTTETSRGGGGFGSTGK